ncbi:AsmA family protein [Novosphingobium panipatense]|uniref:AsmA family protein n=1 Tax=Novosphingobium panipatense TaxID=428991 RepID=UPI0036173AAE
MDAVSTSDPKNAPDGSASRRRTLRLVRNVLLAVVGVIFAAWLILFITKGRFLKHPFESVASSLADREVAVGGDFQLYFAPIRIKFRAEELSVSNPKWAEQPSLFTARSVDARIAPLSMLFGRRRFYTLDIVEGRANLEWDARSERNTWTFGDGKGEPLELPRVDRATITDMRIRYVDPKMPLLANLVLDPVVSKDARIGKAVSVRGDGRFRDTPFRVTARLLSPDETINRGGNAIELRAWAANNVLDVKGELPPLPNSRTCR